MGWLNKARMLKLLDAAAGYPLCWVLGWLDFRFPRQAAPVGNRTPARILVIRPGGMGDMILLLPMLAHLRRTYPEARLTLVCERRNRDVLELAGLASQAILYDEAPFQVWRQLRKDAYDVVLDTEQFHNFSAAMAFASHAPIRIGFKINPSRNLLYTHLVSYDLDGYEGDQFMRLLGPLGVSPADSTIAGALPPPVLDLEPGMQDVADAVKQGSCVAILAGSTSPYKAWDSACFAELVQRLLQHEGTRVLFVGGGADRKAAEAVIARLVPVPGRVFNLAGRLSLRQTAAFLARCSALVAGDSGLTHLAAALRTPTVTLFGPSDHRKWGHQGPLHSVVRRDTHCAPCFIFGYHKLCRTRHCMGELRVDDVLAPLLAILDAAPPRRNG